MRPRIGRREIPHWVDTYVRSDMDLAWHVGAVDDSIPSIRAAVQERWGPRLYLKQAVLPFRESWVLRFLKHPGGWLVTGERARPEPGPRLRGDKLPTYVRTKVPMRSDGIVPRSLAPTKADLPRLMTAQWVGTLPGSRLTVPYAIVKIDAPRWGVTISCKTSRTQPALLPYPFSKYNFDRQALRILREIRSERSEQAKERNRRGLNKRKGSPHRPERAEAQAAADQEPAAVPVLQTRARLRGHGAGGPGGEDRSGREAAGVGSRGVRGGDE